MNTEIKSLGEFAAALIELGKFRDEGSARKAVAGWIGNSGSGDQPFQGIAKLDRFLTNAKALAIRQALCKWDADNTALDLPVPAWSDEKDRITKTAWLTAVINALQPRPAPPPKELRRDDPAWRRVSRGLDAVMAEKLKTCPLLAIIGMSGTGKTLLAQQYYDAAPRPKAWFAAPRPGSESFESVTPATLASKVLGFLADNASHYPGGRDKLVLAFTGLADDLAADVGRALARDKAQVRAAIDQALLELGDNEGAPAIVAAIMRFAQNAQGFAILVRLCGIIVRCLRDNQTHLIVIDDVWETNEVAPGKPSSNTISPLIEALLPRPDDLGPRVQRLHLLLTSQERGASFTNDPKEATARTLELDKDEPEPARFAQRLVAAWGAPPADALTTAEADAAIAAFQNRLEQGDLASQRAVIDGVLKSIGHHPLVTSAIASWWRDEDYDEGVWRGMLSHLGQALPIDRTFDDAGLRGAELSAHHKYVANALLHVVTASLDPVQRARYFDLAVQPGGRALVPAIARLTWERVQRGEKVLGRAEADPITAFFASRMLVQRRDTHVLLHDMHRLVIAAALGAEGLARRHRDLLAAAGLLDGDGRFDIDEPGLFRVEAGDPMIPASGRWMLDLPATHSEALPPAKASRPDINIYFMDALLGHVRAVKSIAGLEDAELRLLTCLRFLQAQLDWIEPGRDEERL